MRERYGTTADLDGRHTDGSFNARRKPMKPLFWLAAAVFCSPLAASEFRLTSTDIAEGQSLSSQHVFEGFGCSGGNRSPQLAWSGAPSGTKSFAITAYDPDAPTGSGWWHWTVVNIPATVNALPSGAGSAGGTLPTPAVQGRTDFGQSGFGGACPPEGDQPHRYQFTVWALKETSLPVDENSSGALVGYLLNAHALGKAQLTALYGR
jgi:hypothetical protein